MARRNKHLVNRIAELQEAIKRKYNQFKYGTVETEQLLEKQYKPLIAGLKRSSNPPSKDKKMKSNTVRSENEEGYEEEEEEDDDADDGGFQPHVFSSPKPPITTYSPSTPTVAQDVVYETSNVGEDELGIQQMLSTDEGQKTASRLMMEHIDNELTRRYMKKLFKNTGGRKGRVIDHVYGPRYNADTLMVGDKPLEFTNDGTIILGDVKYKPTEGLYELLFMHNPDRDLYDENDLIVYKSMLHQTNAHKRDYEFLKTVNRNTSTKYKAVIEKLFPKETYMGKGLGRDLAYWDDPNELCARLSLLTSSVEAGNSSHANEILNIVEELREAGLIKGSGNSRYRSFLQ